MNGNGKSQIEVVKMLFNRLCFMLVISGRPPDGPNMSYWRPFQGESKTIGEIIKSYNETCFERYRRSPGWEDPLKIMNHAMGISIIPTPSEMKTLEEYKLTFFLLVDVDTIQKKLEEVKRIQNRKIQCGDTHCRLIQVSNQSNAVSCAKHFEYLAFAPSDSRIITNLNDFFNVLDGVCDNIYCSNISYYEVPSSESSVNGKEIQIPEKYLQEKADETIKEAIMADLSKEDTVKLARLAYSEVASDFAFKEFVKEGRLTKEQVEITNNKLEVLERNQQRFQDVDSGASRAPQSVSAVSMYFNDLGSDRPWIFDITNVMNGYPRGYSSVVAATHADRKDAFSVNPLVKSGFADDLLNFDFADPRGAFCKAALREWNRTKLFFSYR